MVKVEFYQHQLNSIACMQKLEETKKIKVESWVVETRMGILADPVGSGKTLSIAGVIAENKMDWDISTPFTLSRYTASSDKRNIISYYKVETYEKIDSTLIIVSPSTISHWIDELNRMELKVLCITAKKDIDMTSDLSSDIDVVLISSSIYNNISSRSEIEHKAWKRVVFDEPHGKPPILLPITAGFYWIVSATPSEVYNGVRSGFIHDIFDTFPPEVVSKITVKNRPEVIRCSFELPTVIKKYYECYQPIFNTVKGLVSEDVAQMISAGNISGAVQALGGECTDNIALLVRNIKKKELDNIKSPEDEKRILEQMKELDEKFTDVLSDVCMICYEPIENPVMETSCQNIFCSVCILKWMEQGTPSCPICRTNIKEFKSLVFISSPDSPWTLNNNKKNIRERLPTKQEQLIKIIKENENGKFIVYSTWDESFCSIRNVLEENNISFTEIKGSISTRIKSIESFRMGKTKVIFLNSTHSGAGINLQEATDIIMYHSMPDNIITHAIGRANRIGRTEPLLCHNLI